MTGHEDAGKSFREKRPMTLRIFPRMLREFSMKFAGN